MKKSFQFRSALQCMLAICLLPCAAYAGQCNDGNDNDGDGKVDFSTSECPARGVNLIVNSGFELPVVPSPKANNNYDLYTAIPGWTTTSPGRKFELQRGDIRSRDGKFSIPRQGGWQHLELDNYPDGVKQQLPAYRAGVKLNIGFFYRPRPGYGRQVIQILWNQRQIGKIDLKDDDKGWAWANWIVEVNTGDRANELAIKSVYTQFGGGGMLIDSVSAQYYSGCAAVDPGCSSFADATEQNQCENDRDDDDDGLIDRRDPGCWRSRNNPQSYDPLLDRENEAQPECQDGKDNDGDGARDFPADFSCASKSDDDESNPKSQCQDGIDNDKDGFRDGADPGCSNAQDNNESDATSQCQDRKDNDGDGRIDLADLGCSGPTDDSESGESQCQDGKDNDGDGRIDLADPGCSGPTDDSEGGEFQCQDGKDNDRDGKIDLADPGCSGPADDDEMDKPQCRDGRDNDGDGRVDLADLGCTGPDDDSEGGEPQCLDGRDNDGDGKIDLADPGCSSQTDNDETDQPKAQCNDGKDNDYDGLTDFPEDSGCSSVSDDDESDEPRQCRDGKDNDGDGWIDFPEDTGCSTAEDNDESEATNPITPTVSCVLDNGDGTATAFFGYVNNSGREVTIDAGVSDRKNVNMLSPSPFDQGQPSTFKTGKHDAVFSVVFPAHVTSIWTLMYDGSSKSSATARKGASKECHPITPILECVEKKGYGKLTARFGYKNPNDFEVPMPIGQYNLFIPSPDDRGQPDSFFPGLVKGCLNVDFSGDELTWKLGVKAVTASRLSTPCRGTRDSLVCSTEHVSSGDCERCSITETSDVVREMSESVNDQILLAESALQRLETASSDNEIRRFIAKAHLELRNSAEDAQKSANLLPREIRSCDVISSVCVQSDTVPMLGGYNSAVEAIRKVTQQTLRELSHLKSGKLRTGEKRLGAAADQLSRRARAAAEHLPRFHSDCRSDK